MAANEALGSHTEAPLIPEDSFGLRLVMVRRALNLSQQEAAARCDLDDGSWSNWEGGAKPRRMDEVVSTISKRLEVDRDWLMWGGPLRGQNWKFLTLLPEEMGQGTFFTDDLEPADFFSRPVLASV